MPRSKRNCQDEADYWRIRAFLREIHLVNDRRDLSWPVMRFDYWRWHGIENCGHGQLEQDVFIWETNDGQMAAVLNREGPGEAFLQVHPALRTPDLEGEMLAVAEAILAIDDGNGGRRLRVYVDEGDGLRYDVLCGRGYAKSDWPEYHSVFDHLLRHLRSCAGSKGKSGLLVAGERDGDRWHPGDSPLHRCRDCA